MIRYTADVPRRMLPFVVTLVAGFMGGDLILWAERSAAAAEVQAVIDTTSGQIDVTEGDRPVLRYNYRTVELPPGYEQKIPAGVRKYARPRSNYIHPLFGPGGEQLTTDWNHDHPHHRGIYWAWPEVEYQGDMGDLHALQRVFARPTGKIELSQADDFAAIEAENHWMWDDTTPIVREQTKIRIWKSGIDGRYIDLQFQFTALTENVTLARRDTDKYGGLNLRLAPVTGLNLSHHVDPPGADPRPTWQAATGTWQGANTHVSLAILEHVDNPDFPGDYMQYPELPWFQPTFPRAGSRYPLSQTKPLVLKYRLWIVAGGTPTEAEYRDQWRGYNQVDIGGEATTPK